MSLTPMLRYNLFYSIPCLARAREPLPRTQTTYIHIVYMGYNNIVKSNRSWSIAISCASPKTATRRLHRHHMSVHASTRPAAIHLFMTSREQSCPEGKRFCTPNQPGTRLPCTCPASNYSTSAHDAASGLRIYANSPPLLATGASIITTTHGTCGHNEPGACGRGPDPALGRVKFAPRACSECVRPAIIGEEDCYSNHAGPH